MSEAVRGRQRVFHVTNRGSDSESSDEETTIQNSAHPLPLLLKTNPSPPSPLTTNIPIRAPRYKPSHHSLSSPSSLSSPAAEETPPPSTPGVSGPSIDLTAEDPAIASSASLYDPPQHRSQFHFKSPFHHNPKPNKPGPKRPATSPTISIPDERILILVTADSERYVNVEITGARNPAFIRECVFTKVRCELLAYTTIIAKQVCSSTFTMKKTKLDFPSIKPRLVLMPPVKHLQTRDCLNSAENWEMRKEV